MLVLSRKKNEKIKIGDNITIHIIQIHKNKISIGISAPVQYIIKRGELMPKKE